MSNTLLKRIIRAETSNVILQDLQIHLKRKGDYVDLFALDVKGNPIHKMEDVCDSLPLDRLIRQGHLTLWDENGIQLTDITALKATNLATLKDVAEAVGTGGGGALLNVDGGRSDSIYTGVPIVDAGFL